MSRLHRSVVAFLLVVGGALAGAAQWSGGEGVLVPPGTSLTINTPQPNILCLTNNGTLLFSAGGSVSITGNVVSVIGAHGETGVMTIANDAEVFVTGSTGVNFTFAIGFQGGEGTLNIQPGGSFDAGNATVSVCANNSDTERDPSTRGTLNVAGYFRAGTLGITSFFPNEEEDEYVTAGEVNLLPGGVLEVGVIQKNDRAYSHFYFKGGTLTKRSSGGINTGGNGGHLYYIIDEHCEARIDTGGNNVTFNPVGNALIDISGDGGLRKLGAGMLTFQLADTNNTFTGNIVVEEGILNLGRPLAQGQLVTVHAGANFIINTMSDIPNITYLGSEPFLFTVGVNIDTLDLTAYAPNYYEDRIGGPFAGTTILSGLLTYDALAGTALNPFRLITQGGSLVLTNTGLESAFVQIEGPNTVEFQGNRTFTQADTGKIAFADNGQYQQRGLFTMKDGATLTIEAPARFSTTGSGNALEVGVGGDAVFVSSNATVSVDRLRVGGLPGSVGAFMQDGGQVTAWAESWVGYDSGTGTLHVANGEFRVNANLRVALNVGDQSGRAFRPHGIVNVTNGLLYAHVLNFTPWFPNGAGAANPIANDLHGEVNLFEGGLMDISDINKNDSALSAVFFDGGTLRMRSSSLFAVGGFATLKLSATAGKYITLDLTNPNAVISPTLSGRVVFTGPGGLKKLGSGILSFFAHQADYLGDTLIEAGSLRLLSANVLPHGPGKGNLVLQENTTLDLFGNEVTLNNIEGPGRIVNGTTNNLTATIALLADGSDGSWSRVVTGGPFALKKVGGGTLTLSGYNLAPEGLTIAQGTVRIVPSEGYPFYRFKVEATKGANMMQFCALALYNGTTDLTQLRSGLLWDAEYSDDLTSSQTYPGNESPPNVVDGRLPPESESSVTGSNVCTKWLDFRMSPTRSQEDRDRVWIRLGFPEAQKVTHYNWATANDSPDRDPSAWRFQGSYTGDDWRDLHTVSGFQGTNWRFKWVDDDGFSVNTLNESGSTIGADVPVAISSGASLVLDGVSETIGGLSGYGTVTLNNGDLTISTEDGSTHIFVGDISGSGSLIKTGLGTQTFNGVNTFTGDFIVQEGTAKIEIMSPTFDWFRFTAKETRSRGNVMQFSELALYDANGTRANLHLTQGDSAATLNPGETATPVPYSLGNGEENILKLFDNDLVSGRSKWCTNDPIPPTPADPATWRTVVMRLADGSPEIASYNLATANDSNERDPITWAIEGSPNGKDWWMLDTQTEFIPTATRSVWYNGNTPFTFDIPAFLPLTAGAGTLAVPNGSAVDVRAGATLSIVNGPVPISALRVDMVAGAGTITHFTPTENGSLYLTNTSGAPVSWQIPITFGAVDNPANLRKWQVYANGVLLNGYVLSFDAATSTLRLLPQGTIIILK